jgi:hypothetical protein
LTFSENAIFGDGDDTTEVINLATRTASSPAYTGEHFTLSSSIADVTNIRLVATGGSTLGLSELAFTAVPEPSAFALLAGMFGLTWVMVRRRA